MIKYAYPVRHFRGKKYWVQGTVINASNNNEIMILYVSDETHEMYVRSEHGFWEEILYNGEYVQRFAKIDVWDDALEE